VPARPNAIGLLVVKLIKREGDCWQIENVDMQNNLPLPHIKPFIPDVNSVRKCRYGWLSKQKKIPKNEESDGRFNRLD